MGAYERGRDNQYLASLDGPIRHFITQHAANYPAKNRRTIFLFPGGMGSQLMRARRSAKHGPSFYYDDIWLNCATLTGGAIDLQMHGDIDYQRRYIIPDGCVDFLTLQPYQDFIDWCEVNYLDLFVFGWDWRRDACQIADFFLEEFLPKFEHCVKDCKPNPLDDFTLLSHSFGGLVVKLILNKKNNQYVQRMQRAITVAAPFYGYGGQLHRYFKGDKDFNRFYGATTATEIVSTCPGLYQLLFLDGATYDANIAALQSDPDNYNVGGGSKPSYPSWDAITGQRADPYNPVPGKPKGAKGLVRYISNHKFDWDLLKAALKVRTNVASDLDSGVATKFFNIRGVQTLYGNDVPGTPVSQSWSKVKPTFNPDKSTDPIIDTWGPGDGTIPAWSARFASNTTRVKTIKGEQSDFEHMMMMKYLSVHTAIWEMLGLSVATMKPVYARKIPTASRADLNNFLDGLRIATLRKRSHEQRMQAIRTYLRNFDRDRLEEFLNRGYIDLLKSPAQKEL